MVNQFFNPFLDADISLRPSFEGPQTFFSFLFPQVLPQWFQSMEFTAQGPVFRLRHVMFLLPTLYFLVNHAGASETTLTDLYVADYPSRLRRFELSYRLRNYRANRAFAKPGVRRDRRMDLAYVLSGTQFPFLLYFPFSAAMHTGAVPYFLYPQTRRTLPVNFTVTLRVSIPFGSPVPSVTTLFKSAQWLEREAWDMFGVYFVGSSDLRRILTDYGFEGFPLRKEFPVTGYSAVRYDIEEKKIVLEPLDFSFGQEYRYYDFTSPWRRK